MNAENEIYLRQALTPETGAVGLDTIRFSRCDIIFDGTQTASQAQEVMGTAVRAILMATRTCALLSTLILGSRIASPSARISASAPMTVDHNRAVVSVVFGLPGGGERQARFWIDSGNPDLVISEQLARDLRLNLTVPPVHDDFYGRVVRVRLPGGRIGSQYVGFSGLFALVPLGQKVLFPGMGVDGNLPSTLLARYDVVLDYPHRRFAIAPPGVLHPQGTRLPCRVNPRTGMVTIAAVIDDRKYDLALDNGASFSLISQPLIGRLLLDHPDMPHFEGAIGAANMWGTQDEAALTLVKIPRLAWGGMEIANVGAAAISKAFIGWYSQKTPVPVAGLIGGNVLREFRVEIHYQSHAVYLQATGRNGLHDMDLVGLILRPQADGTYSIVGTARGKKNHSVPGVTTGDELLAVDGRATRGRTMGQVVDSLRGRPGQLRRLTLKRGGREFAVNARVNRFW